MDKIAGYLLLTAIITKDATMTLSLYLVWKRPSISIPYICILLLLMYSSIEYFVQYIMLYSPFMSLWVLFLISKKRWIFVYIPFAVIDTWVTASYVFS